jgi:hypothetical protein
MVTKVRQNKDNTMICKVKIAIITKLRFGPEVLYGDRLPKSMQFLLTLFILGKWKITKWSPCRIFWREDGN